MPGTCSHIDSALPPSSTPERVCPACLEAGDRWVHLRVCLACGHVGCCDSSPNRHASRHWRETGHPVVQSIEPGESWVWCYEDRVFAEAGS